MDTLCLDLIGVIKCKLSTSECIFLGFVVCTENEYFEMLNDWQRLEFAIKTKNVNWIHELRNNVNKLMVLKYAIEHENGWLVESIGPNDIPRHLWSLFRCPPGTSVDKYLTIAGWENAKTEEDLQLSIFAINKQYDLFVECYDRSSEKSRLKWQDYLLLFLYNDCRRQDVDFVVKFLSNNQQLKASKFFISQLTSLKQYDILEYIFSTTAHINNIADLDDQTIKYIVADGKIVLLSKYNDVCWGNNCVDAIIIACINSDIEALEFLGQCYVDDDDDWGDNFISIASGYCMTDEVYRYLSKHPNINKRQLRPPGSTFRMIHQMIEDLRPYIEETDCFHHINIEKLKCDLELITIICTTIIEQAQRFETVVGVFEVIAHMDIKAFINKLAYRGDGSYVDTIKQYAKFTDKQLEDVAELFSLDVNEGRLLLRIITHPSIWRCKMVV